MKSKTLENLLAAVFATAAFVFPSKARTITEVQTPEFYRQRYQTLYKYNQNLQPSQIIYIPGKNKFEVIPLLYIKGRDSSKPRNLLYVPWIDEFKPVPLKRE